jgi:hypothetical protein
VRRHDRTRSYTKTRIFFRGFNAVTKTHIFFRGFRAATIWLVTTAALGALLAGQAGVASASAPLSLHSGMAQVAPAPAEPSPTGTWSLKVEFENVQESSYYRHGEDNVTFTPTTPDTYTITIASASGGGTSNVPISGNSFEFWECSASAGGAIYSEQEKSSCPKTSGHYQESWKFDYSTDPYTATGTFQAYGADGSTEDQQYGKFTAVGPTTDTTVSGRIVTPEKEGEAGVRVELAGDASATTTTNSEGDYSFAVAPGEYQVAPVPAGPNALDEFKPEQCDGTVHGTFCSNIKVEAEQQAVANFSGGFTLSGTVLGASGSGVSGATVNIQDKEQGTTKSLSAMTNSEGKFETRIAPGSLAVTVEKLAGAEYFPVRSTNCTVSSHGCVVELNQDRSVEFASCIVPNPNGEPLPAGTPEPIPGAQTIGNLEAVGCWAPQPDGTYTSTKPVRLNGIDVNPTGGTKIILNPDATVTSDGPAEVGPGGAFKIPLEKVDLGFQAAQMQASDLGTTAPTFGVPMSIKGVPFSLTTGGSGQTLDPPWVSVGGKTSININLQFPTTLNATSWNVEKGAFYNGGEQISSLGGAVTLSVTNRDGLIAPEICAKFTGGELKLWNLNSELSGIKQFTACYDLHAEQWTLTGLFNLPASVKNFANAVYIKLGWIKGWNWNEGQIEFDGIQKMLAEGVYVQRFGAKFHRDFTTVPPTGSNFGITIGLSFGPQLNIKNAEKLVKQFPGLDGAELMTLDGEGSLQPWSSPPVYKVSGDILILRNTPLQAVLAGANVAYYSSGRFDMSGELRLVMPFTRWSLDGLVSGFLDTEHNVVQLSGTASVSGPWSSHATAQVLLNNGALAACVTGPGGFSAGGVYNYFTEEDKLFKSGTCEIGAYTLKAPAYPSPPAAGASASRAAPGRHVLRLPAHLSGTTIAVQGRGAAPLVKLHGPGLTVSTPGGEQGLVNSHVFIDKVPSSHTTYVTLYRPHGGSWTITQLPGSAPITSVRAALPAPRATVKAHISGPQCKRTLSYTAHIPADESVGLYAQNGATRTFLGDARSRGRLSFSPDVQVTGAGEVIATEERGEVPRSIRTIARFTTVALTKPERIGGLRLHKSTLSWTAACDAAKYTITVHAGKRVLDLTSTSPTIKLPALKGSFTVTVTAIAAEGAQGPPLTKKLRAK